jgi:hypothetical protein
LGNRSVRWMALIAPLVVAVVVGCAQSQQAASNATAPPAPATAAPATAPGEDFEATTADFVNVNDMTAVRGFFISNRLGHLDQALAVAGNPNGGVYPVGTIIQLVPGEAMVKRRAGFDPASNDWEFFELDTSATGTVIHKRGGADIVNRFGNSCADCHKMAEPEFDFICEQTHGCNPLPIGPDVFKALQQGDPRPRTQ